MAKPTAMVVDEIVRRFKFRRFSKVGDYNRFGYLRETERTVYVSRDRGKDTAIPFAKIAVAVEAVRKDTGIYSGGPGKLPAHGVTHINSPVWSLLHMLTLDELTS